MEAYEGKLHLIEQYLRRQQIVKELKTQLESVTSTSIQSLLTQLEG